MFLLRSLPVLLFCGALLLVYGLEAWLLLGALLRHERRRLLRARPALALHLVALAGLGCMAYGFFIEPYRLTLTRLEIATPKLEQARLRIVHFSDTHCDPTPRLEERLTRRVNALDPDLVVFTGDALNHSGALARFQETLAGMKASLAKLAVYGNFDYHHPLRERLLRGTGFRLVDGRPLRLTYGEETIQVTGLSRYPRGGGEIEGALAGLAEGTFTLFLFHYPDLIEDVPPGRVDLYLCGHTHGGQVRLPGYGALITLSRHGKKYEAGLYRVGSMRAYVNRGIGMEGGAAPRVRFLAPPEITVIDLVPARGR